MTNTHSAQDMTIPRPEHPRPQMFRPDWMNLNGEWSFEVDAGATGRPRGLAQAETLSGRILVPFCPESRLSGLALLDFMAAVWYRRTFELPDGWAERRVLLHIGASDYRTEVWVNGRSAGVHVGGYSSFQFDITDLLKTGKNTVTVCAEDDVRSGRQPRGKQSAEYHSHGCEYTRTTGIWQTVWLESVARAYIRSSKYVPDPENGCLHVEALLSGPSEGLVFEAEARFEGRPAGSASAIVCGDRVRLTLPLSERHLWQPGNPALYDLTLWLGAATMKTVATTDVPAGMGSRSEAISQPEQAEAGDADVVQSYFGLRSVSWGDKVFRLNGNPVFMRLVLDQGFYPDGIYTAPSDEELRLDIERSMAFGFNGARLHEKIFEPRFLYWADRLGYLVWGEHANWGLDITGAEGLQHFLPEWLESIERDFNAPSLIGWCPFNETWDLDGRKQNNEVLRQVYLVTKAVDPTRPVIDTSGNFHVVTDLFDVHDYEQDPALFAANYAPMAEGGEAFVTYPERQKYEGQPYFVSEYGGIWWSPGGSDASWGYGNRPKDEAEFLARYEGLTTALLDNPAITGFCYTQLTDVEQETNGLYTYDRKPKFDVEIIRRVNLRKAAIEKD